MHSHHDSDHYDVQFTTRQLVVLFGLLIVIVAGVFVGGIVIGRGIAPEVAEAVVARRTSPAPVSAPAAAPAEAPAEDALRLPIETGSRTGSRAASQTAAGTARRVPERPARAATEPSRAPTRRASTNPEQLSNRTLAPARPAAAASSAAAATAPSPAPGAADRPTPQGGGFTIQVAAFRDRAAAERMLQQLAARGIEGYLEGAPSGVFRVRVGRFESREAAREVAARLEGEQFATLVTSR